MSISDTNEAAEKLVSTISNIIKDNTTVIKVRKRDRNIKPWITPGLLKCIRNRDKMHLKLKNNPTNLIIKITYSRYRNFCNGLIKKLRISYQQEQFTKAKNNPKATWEVIKNICDTQLSKSCPVELLKSSQNVSQSVNSINKYFVDVGQKLASKIQLPDQAPPNRPSRPQSQLNSFALLDTDHAEIEKLVKELRHGCATGWDNIPSRVIKSSAPKLIPYITHICNLALSSGVFPSVFKRALVHPVFKGGDRDSVNNYRPISVLPALSKILERLLNCRLVSYLEINNILAPNQFGFRSGLSTEDAVAFLTEEAVKRLDDRKKTLGIFLDLSKAFDTVSVPRLLCKMEDIGIRGVGLNIFRDYLNNRSQAVKIGPYISEPEIITFGIPQGSILGPTLFLIYINELCNLQLTNCSISSYADDTALLVHGDDWDSTVHHAENAIHQVMNWLSFNLLTLNLAKTKYIAFRMRNTKSIQLDNLAIAAHNCNRLGLDCNCPSLSRVSNIKYLGVFIDENLNWSVHVKSVIARARKTIYIFKKLRGSADKNTLMMVYFSLCQSLFSYCIPVWGGCFKTTLIELERAQRAVLKVMLKKPFIYPTVKLHSELKVLSIRQLYVLSIVLRKHTTVPYVGMHNVTRRRDDLVCPTEKTRTEFARSQHKIASARLYNVINRLLNIYPINKYECKQKITNFLYKLDYCKTEQLISNKMNFLDLCLHLEL